MMNRARFASVGALVLMMVLGTPALVLAGTAASASRPDPDLASVRIPGDLSDAAGRAFLREIPGLILAGKGGPENISEDLVVRLAYENLAAFTRLSQMPVIFEVRSPRTVYHWDFGATEWQELVSLDRPRRLSINRVEAGFDGEPGGVAYEPAWGKNPWLEDRATMGHYATMSVAEVLAGAPRAAERGRVLAATTYEVTARFAGLEDRYRAALLWISKGAERVVFEIEDHVTNRVDEALVERMRVASRYELLGAPRLAELLGGTGGGGGGATKSGNFCRQLEVTHTFPMSTPLNTQGHRDGGHQASTTFAYTCTCNPDCRSTCTPQAADQVCSESGGLVGAGVHKTHSSVKLVGGSIQGTNFQGANCGAGTACYVQWCPGTCSGFQISVSAEPLGIGTKVTFNASSSVVFDGQLDFPFQCDGCSSGEEGDDDLSGGGAAPPPDEQDPFPDSGPGGGGGGGIGCKQSIWTCGPLRAAGGQWHEECRLTCVQW